MAEFQLPDRKKLSGNILGVALAAGLGLLTYSYILPWLNKVVWGTAELIGGIVAAGLLLYIVTNKTFWKRGKIILDALGELSFKWFIEMNPFVIMEMQVDKADKDREKLREQCENLKAQESKLSTQIAENQQTMRLASKQIEICQKRIENNPSDEQLVMDLETSTVDFNNSKSFIDDVQPILTNITKLVTFADVAYRKSGNALKNAKNTILVQRAKYDAVTAGSNAMKKALRAFTGDPEMNKAGAIALQKLQTDIAQKIGAIKTSIQISSQIMNERDLKDAAKVALAAETAEKLNIDSKFDYAATIEGPQLVGANAGKNKYLSYLKKS